MRVEHVDMRTVSLSMLRPLDCFGGKSRFLGGQDLFLYKFETNFSGHNKILRRFDKIRRALLLNPPTMAKRLALAEIWQQHSSASRPVWSRAVLDRHFSVYKLVCEKESVKSNPSNTFSTRQATNHCKDNHRKQKTQIADTS